jgi:excisionase family DNA binding protein
MRREQVPQFLLRPMEAARALSCSRTRVYQMIHEGSLPHLLLGGTSIRIPRQAIDAMIDAAMAPQESLSR